jgi:predicted amidohydrolase YtcJ
VLVGACAGAGPSSQRVGGERSPSPRSTPDKVADAEAADLVLTGGVLRTMVPDRPLAEAVAIRGGRIVAVGTAGAVSTRIGPRTRVVDLRGRTVTPGLVDAHCHLYGLGTSLETLALRGLSSPQAVAERVAAATAGRAEGEWITGRGWDQNLWAGAEFPTHAALDAAAPRHPVALDRVDGHALWANAAAMRAAGVGRKTPDPPGGKILRDKAGEPTGVFIDNAMELIDSKAPAASPEVRERRILRAAGLAVSLGLTGVHEMGIDDQTVAVYRALASAGKLPLRVNAYLSGAGQMDSLASRKPDTDPEGTATFVLRGVKLFADGALGSRGAALLAPYSDDPGNTGLMTMRPEELRRSARLAVESGYQLAVHAIGDRANREVLDAYEAAGAGRGADRRFRVEHAQIVAPEDIKRFSALGVIASMQPTHATSDMPWAEARLGPARLRGAYAWRSILATGAHVAFGSDFPVEETSPLLGVYAAVTRQDANGNPPGGWRSTLSDERLSLDEALRLFTVEPAYAAFAEAHRGKIAEGFVADLTVFDRALSADRGLLATKVDLVIVGGQVVLEARQGD